MKTIKSAVFVLAIAFSSTLAASTPTTPWITTAQQDLRTLIEDHLEHMYIGAEHGTSARISFRIAADNVIEVLRTEGASQKLQRQIMNRMESLRVDIPELPSDQVYHININFKAE